MPMTELNLVLEQIKEPVNQENYSLQLWNSVLIDITNTNMDMKIICVWMYVRVCVCTRAFRQK